MGPFVLSNQNQYILGAVDYVSTWVDAAAFPIIDVKAVIKFVKNNIFTRFGTPMTIISNEGSNFYNQAFEILLAKYGVKHKTATTSHAQTSGQAEISNRKSKGFWRR